MFSPKASPASEKRATNTPKTLGKTWASFAAVLVAPNKTNCIGQLQAALDMITEENRDLKACLSTLEARFYSMVGVATNKVKEVEEKVTQAHTITLAKVETCVKTELRERQLQEENALKLCIGGLPQAWDEYKQDFCKLIDLLNETLKSVHVDYDAVECIVNKFNTKRTPVYMPFLSSKTKRNSFDYSSNRVSLETPGQRENRLYPLELQRFHLLWLLDSEWRISRCAEQKREEACSCTSALSYILAFLLELLPAWQRWLSQHGSLTRQTQYVLYIPLAARAWYKGLIQEDPLVENLCFHMLVLVGSRYLMFQIWGTVSRLPWFSRKHQIVTKGIKFEQIDHEASWENMMIVTSYILWIGAVFSFPKKGLPWWDWWGVPIVIVMHCGPIEWIYYWAHRTLHHHFLFTRYHQHHHSSFVTQPITSSNHPFLEILFYNGLFGLPLSATLLLDHSSIGIFYLYVLFIDFMNSWGHCNFEFIPAWIYDTAPFLKYIVYSPTYHSLHHTKVHTNFSLFMPIYDYIYGTVDSTSDSLHQIVRKGHETKVDCVYLTHATDVLSIFHLQFGFQSFAAQPYSEKWPMWIMWPIAVPLMLLAWLCAKPFVGATHFVGGKLELQTWVIPRFSFQYSLSCEAAKIKDWIKECILEAQQAGVKVFALGLLNKDMNVDMEDVLMCKEVVNIAIVTGETLAAAIVAKEVEVKHSNDVREVFVTLAHTRVGQAISTYLCERGFKVWAVLPTEEHAKYLRNCISPVSRANLVHVTSYNDGKECKVWIVGEKIGHAAQKLAPKGTYFYPFGEFPAEKWRKDCFYGNVPSLRVPKNAENINACQDVMPRYVVRASYAAAIVHALEGLRYHDFGGDILVELMEKSWESAIKHGFSTIDGHTSVT
ncbi:hypothetical protein L7F22_024852 [Adiantum nelumboides]|nr:hypothetical protein [Adiantum nelumboides]